MSPGKSTEKPSDPLFDVEPNTTQENSGNFQQKDYYCTHLLVYSTNIYAVALHVAHIVKVLGNMMGTNI